MRLDDGFHLPLTQAEAVLLRAALRDHVRAVEAHAAADDSGSHPPSQVEELRTTAGRLIWRLEELGAGGSRVQHSDDAVPPGPD